MKQKSATNYGIQSQHVTADNIAVGQGAKISVKGDYVKNIDKDLEELRSYIADNMGIADLRDEILEKISKLEQETKKSDGNTITIKKIIGDIELIFKKGGTLIAGGHQFLALLSRIGSVFS